MARVVSNEVLEKFLKQELPTNQLEYTGHFGGGCINEGQSFKTDLGVLFVKTNKKDGSRLMFEGEYNSLHAIMSSGTVRVPKPMKNISIIHTLPTLPTDISWNYSVKFIQGCTQVLDHPEGSGAMLVMEHLDLKSLTNHQYQAMLGLQLARLHLYNIDKLSRNDADAIHKFGFHSSTCCGYLSMSNEWTDDWVAFYINNRLESQINKLLAEHDDREVKELWAKLKAKIPQYFEGLEVKPSLLHGDLWGGNIGQIETGPVIFDPASFYGHHEFELAIAGIFGGFSSEFYNSYHQLIPKEPGFDDRHHLYQLFHYLNHWNHFGSSYRPSAINIMKSLTAM